MSSCGVGREPRLGRGARCSRGGCRGRWRRRWPARRASERRRRPPAPRRAARARARPRRPARCPWSTAGATTSPRPRRAGVPLAEVDARTMESRRQPGLFLVGEMLDVDGRIGGFNFQWAWSSAWVAAGGLVARAVIVSRAGKGVAVPAYRYVVRGASRASGTATSSCGRRRPSGSSGFARNLPDGAVEVLAEGATRPSPTSRPGCARGRRSRRWRASSARRARTAGRAASTSDRRGATVDEHPRTGRGAPVVDPGRARLPEAGDRLQGHHDPAARPGALPPRARPA